MQQQPPDPSFLNDASSLRRHSEDSVDSHTNSTTITTPSSRDTSMSIHTPVESVYNHLEVTASTHRQHHRESSLLAHLQLDEDEERAWQAVASPPKAPKPERLRMAHPQSVPAYCFPSLRGKIPAPVETPTIEIPDPIQTLERPKVRREQSEVRFSVYVNANDFLDLGSSNNMPPPPPPSGWVNKLRHSHRSSISDIFGFAKKQKEHKKSKSFSEYEKWL